MPHSVLALFSPRSPRTYLPSLVPISSPPSPPPRPLGLATMVHNSSILLGFSVRMTIRPQHGKGAFRCRMPLAMCQRAKVEVLLSIVSCRSPLHLLSSVFDVLTPHPFPSFVFVFLLLLLFFLVLPGSPPGRLREKLAFPGHSRTNP